AGPLGNPLCHRPEDVSLCGLYPVGGHHLVRLRRCRSYKAACSPEDHRARQTLTRSYHQCAEVPGKTRAYMQPPGQKIPPALKVPGADH
ncbi:hypothetical protein PIB30_114174, partial [Stylosanthes scabra]|nr:hypothetical protein [Stylosanthes scabra]